MMQDWPSLWEREPGLRPDAVRYSDHPLEFIRGWHVGDMRVESDPRAASAFAALCEYAATKWLLERGCTLHHGYPFSVSYDSPSGRRRIGKIAVNDDGTGRSDCGGTLFEACKIMLHLRDAAKE